MNGASKLKLKVDKNRYKKTQAQFILAFLPALFLEVDHAFIDYKFDY